MRSTIPTCIIFLILTTLSCGDRCSEYKKLACEDLNSGVCHSAMQDMERMSKAECTEKIKVLGSVRAMQDLEEEIEAEKQRQNQNNSDEH